MPFFGVPIRNGLPIGLGSVAGFGVQQFDPSLLFEGGTVPGAWYDPSDLTTLFTTSAGTTPVSMPGQGSAVSVGLMLDKSQGLVLGPQTELVTNGTFNTDITGWTFTGTGGTATWNAGSARIAMSTATSKQFSQGISVVAGKSYTITGTVTPVSGTLTATLTLRTTNDVATSVNIAGGSFLASGGTFSFKYIATTTTTVFVCIQCFTTVSTFDVDNVSIVEWLQGNHAIAINDSTARPELRARVNLLTYSEEFNNAAWGKTNLNTTGTPPWVNVTASPDGTMTADALIPNTSSGQHYVVQSAIAPASSTLTLSVCAKKNGYDFLGLEIGAVGANRFDLSTPNGTVLGVGWDPGVPIAPATITPLGNGWFRCSITVTTTVAASVYIGVWSTSSSTSNYTGNGTSGIYIWGADLRPANIGANVPAYQRIADANTYDTNGFPLYLFFNGLDDGMYTPANLNLSATDKVGVFAGVRKLSDSTIGFITELSANANTTNGTFQLRGPDSAADYYATVRGTSLAQYIPVTFAAPISNVVSSIMNIAGASISTELIPRVNGVVEQDSPTGTAGTGNFGTHPLYIGSRNNGSFFFNGHLHGLIVVGSAVSAGNISATESWMAQRTGIQI